MLRSTTFFALVAFLVFMRFPAAVSGQSFSEARRAFEKAFRTNDHSNQKQALRNLAATVRALSAYAL